MSDHPRTRSSRQRVLAAAVLLAGLLVAACSSQGGPTSGGVTPGTIANVRGNEQPGVATTLPPSNSGAGSPPTPGSITGNRPPTS